MALAAGDAPEAVEEAAALAVDVAEDADCKLKQINLNDTFLMKGAFNYAKR
jgi:hypothetical protein